MPRSWRADTYHSGTNCICTPSIYPGEQANGAPGCNPRGREKIRIRFLETPPSRKQSNWTETQDSGTGIYSTHASR